MSHETIGFCTCPEIQDDLNSYFTQCDPTKLIAAHEVGMVRFLNSPTNRSGIFQSQITPGNGKKKMLQLTYTPRILPSEIGTSCEKVCSSNTAYGNLCHEYEMGDDCLSAHWYFTLGDLATLCKANDLFIAESIYNHMSALLRRLDIEYADAMVALAGDFANGETGTNAGNNEKTIATRNADNTIDTTGFEEIIFASRNASYCSVPFIIGWNEIQKYMTRLQSGCCAAQGIDLADLVMKHDHVFIPDVNIDSGTAFSANHFITMAAGAVQPLFFNEFSGPAGINTVETEMYKQTVLKHPEYDVPFDFIWSNDCGKINLFIKLNWDLMGMPDDMWFAGDRLTDVTFVNEYVITNP